MTLTRPLIALQESVEWFLQNYDKARTGKPQ